MTQTRPFSGRALSIFFLSYCWCHVVLPISTSQLKCHAFSTCQFQPNRESLLCLHAEKKKRQLTIRDLIQEVERNPAAFSDQRSSKDDNKKRYKRTRKRAHNPKQSYLYAAQRVTLERDGKLNATSSVDEFSPLFQARQLGLVNPAAQHIDAPVVTKEPEIVATIRVGEEEGTSGFLAYIVEKPPGWAVLGGTSKKKKQPGLTKRETIPTNEKRDSSRPSEAQDKAKGSRIKRVKVMEDDGSVDVLEYDEADILSAMTPEEIAEFREEGGFVALETEQPIVVERKREARTEGAEDLASFATASRPSLVAWLKELKAAEGNPIRGGNYWTAIAGATSVDDTGLVLLCPRDKANSVFIDFAKYTAVVGRGKYLSPRGKKTEAEAIPKDLTKMEIIAKLRKKRIDDIALTVGITILETMSTCESIIHLCQSQFQDGIRGDPAANPLDRRAHRRLIHCNALSVSSLLFDQNVVAESKGLPDDISILAERRNKHQYIGGSFLGRAALKQNPLTTAYREINGAADGFEGWTVDRYDKWLLVQHDNRFDRGPLPSIHDGNTAGVYYLPSNQNRGAMGSRDDMRPVLLEGQPAPDTIPVLENGITYHVSLVKDLSTGIFLDQRPQRAWLAKNCDKNTRVLNCFAHCGAFSIAAATAGASTVSLDLNKKWLDRVEPQLLANGIDFDAKHDCIYGDCFDWLTRLSKRGEKYDVVILDPPSSSVGKKKRWSVKSDMGSLVALAAPLVKKGGLLWTSTNSASIHPVKFARMCKKGLDEAGCASAILERVVPMPVDFPSIGPQPVKNLVWRLP